MAQNLSPRAFTEEFAKEFRRAIPSATITRGDLEVTVRRPSGSTTINLHNAYTVYSREPQRLKELIATQLALAATLQSAPAATPAKLDPARIVPVIKGRAWLQDVQEQIKKSGALQEQLFEDFNDDLVVAYAEDTSKAMRYLTVAEYSGDRAKLRALAIENLRRVLPKIQMQIFNEDLSAISAGEDYTASLLWTGGQIKVQGETVVAVPTRDVLLVTGSRSPTLRNFRNVAADLYAKGPYAITNSLLVYRNKQFVKFAGN